MKRIDAALRAGVAFTALVSAATAAQAQSTLPPPEVVTGQAPPAEPATAAKGPRNEIVITGSRIRHNPLDQPSPVTFVDQQDIQKTGLNSINDVLQRLPSAGGGLNSKFNNSGNFGNPPNGQGVGAGAAEIDLRYLGSARTLVLVDGLRFVSGASASGVPGSVDLNAIPESMIERVEVLQDGASAIYGSDAIAGVVNIITKRGQDGFVASAQLGKYLDQGDGFTQNYQLSWGNGTAGPTQVVIAADFVKQNEISSADRSISLFPTPGATACDRFCSSGTPNGRFILDFPPPDGQDLTLIAPVIGRAPTLADYRNFVSPNDRFNFAPFNLIQIPLKRYGISGSIHQELTPSMNFSARLLYNRRNSANQAAPLPLFVGPDAGNGNLLDRITIDASNPFNPFGTLSSGVNLDGTPSALPRNYAFIGRRVVENGPRRYDQKVNTWYGTATLDGSFGTGDRDWYWDINGIWGRNKADQTVHGNFNAANLAQALGPLANCTGACVPFNIFGGEGSITQQMLDFVAFTQRDSSEQKIWGVSGNISGKLLDLPGGQLGVAAGLEYRDLKGRFDPDPIVAAGLGSDIPALPTKGSYNVKEAYLELDAPILSHRPFFELLELDGAARFSDYSTSGSTTTFKGQVNWKPIADVRLRGGYSEGFRAPTIGELFGSASRFDQEIADPCSRDQNPSGAILANCQTIFAALGAGANLATYTQNNPQLSVLTSGNEKLKPETSKGWNAGVVVSPRAIPRLSIEANWYKIQIKDAIFASATETLARCIGTLDPIACAQVTRTSSGQIAQISGVLGNVNGINTDGIDLNFAYRTAPSHIGTFAFTLNNTFLRKYDVIVPTAGGSAKITREGTEQGSPDQAFPKHKAIGIVDWSGFGFGLTLTGRYISHVTESQNGNRLGSRFYTDIQGRWSPHFWGDRIGFALGVNNLFDRDPPGCISCGLNNYDPGTYDVPGRYYYARIGVRY
ncbi:MAG TPA: TonB-dependent receptor [Tepidisphaeraceae bacterium]|nr:TonB-dependent receptor [Tepidisphaeraceae bacterium]